MNPRLQPWQGCTLPLSYTRIFDYYWCLGAESTHRHEDFQSSALPTELPRHLATQMGLEPTTSSVTGWHSKPTELLRRIWWAMTGSNCRHLACKASALPAELITRNVNCKKNNTISPSLCQHFFLSFLSELAHLSPLD